MVRTEALLTQHAAAPAEPAAPLEDGVHLGLYWTPWETVYSYFCHSAWFLVL